MVAKKYIFSYACHASPTTWFFVHPKFAGLRGLYINPLVSQSLWSVFGETCRKSETRNQMGCNKSSPKGFWHVFLMKYLHQHASTRFFLNSSAIWGEKKVLVSGCFWHWLYQMSYEFFPKLVNLSMFQLPDWESELLWHLAAMGNHNLDRTWSKQWIFKGKSTGNQGFTIKYRGFL